mgnify:CR=1 FL=1
MDDDRLERPLRQAIVTLYRAHNPDQLQRLPVIWPKYKGHVALGELLRQLQVKYNVPRLAPESVEAAESAAAEAAESAEAAEEEPGLTPREAGVSLLEIHAVAHTRNDALPCLRWGWSDTVMRLLTPGSGPFALMLLTHGSESLELWQTIVRRVLLQTPTQWRKAEEKEKKRLKDYIGDLWKLFVTSYNASPGSIAETISIAEAVTEASRSWEGVSFAMAPKYEWNTHEMSCHLKYSVQKLQARARYRKATKRLSLIHI